MPAPLSCDIKGKTPLVTGANRGIGKANVESFLAHGAVKVYAGVRKLNSTAVLVQEYGEKGAPLLSDPDAPATITAAAAAAQDVEVVVNDADILLPGSVLDAAAAAHLELEMKTNVFSLIRMAQATAPVLERNGGGAFVQINFVISMMSFADSATYCATKAASYSLTPQLRITLAEQGTQVLSVHPGPIATAMGDAAGLSAIAKPAAIVGDGIVAALRAAEFHVFPDEMAQGIWAAYRGSAEQIIASRKSDA